MFLQQIEEFSEFLGMSDHNLDDILKYLTVFTFAPLDCNGTFISAINLDGTAQLIGKFGMEKEIFNSYPKEISLSEKHPIADAVKNRRSIWINTLPDWGSSYESLNGDGTEIAAKTFICWPVERNHSPIGTMGIFCSEVADPSDEVNAFLKTITNIFVMFFYQLNDDVKEIQRETQIRSTARSAFEGQKLTERQSQILHLMAEGKTNLAISEILGFSESTIRQESIKIYSKLRCAGRKEAALIFNEMRKEAAVAS